MKTKLVHRSIAFTIGILSIPLAVWMISTTTSAFWLLATAAVYLSFALSLSVGYHRLMTHKSFDCNPVWHKVFGTIGCIALIASPIEWAMYHIFHHRYADTDKDPHKDYKGLVYYYRYWPMNEIYVTKSVYRMAKNPMHMFFRNNSLTISLAYGAVVTVLFGLQGLVFLYLLPVTLFIIANGLHNTYAHNAQGARDMPLMEFLVPAGGEWNHKNHHQNPKSATFNSITDLGYYLIQMIRTDRPSNATASS